MFIDVYFTEHLPPDIEMDDVEDAFAELDGFEVVGAGGGDLGSNIDLEVTSSTPRDDALRMVARILSELDVAAISYVRPSDTRQPINIADLLP
jgi:hypothetical protein